MRTWILIYDCQNITPHFSPFQNQNTTRHSFSQPMGRSYYFDLWKSCSCKFRFCNNSLTIAFYGSINKVHSPCTVRTNLSRIFGRQYRRVFPSHASTTYCRVDFFVEREKLRISLSHEKDHSCGQAYLSCLILKQVISLNAYRRSWHFHWS